MSWAAVAAIVLAAAAGKADDGPAALRARAAEASYNLDYAEAEALYQRALALAPDDVRAHRGLATVQWLRVTFARGTVTADEFLGGRARRTIELPPPPPALARAFHEHADRAVALASAAVKARPRDVDALFEYGASMGLVASVHGDGGRPALRLAGAGAIGVRRPRARPRTRAVAR